MGREQRVHLRATAAWRPMGTGRRSFAWYRAWPFLLLWAIAALGMALMFLPPAGGLEPAVPAAASAGRPGPGTRLLRHILRTAIPVLQWVDPPPSLTDPQGLNPGRLLRLFMEAGGGMSLGRPWTLLAAELPGLGTMAPPPASHASGGQPPLIPRSEEHTSELQSRENLVCRLLLEKKKTSKRHTKARTL